MEEGRLNFFEIYFKMAQERNLCWSYIFCQGKDRVSYSILQHLMLVSVHIQNHLQVVIAIPIFFHTYTPIPSQLDHFIRAGNFIFFLSFKLCSQKWQPYPQGSHSFLNTQRDLIADLAIEYLQVLKYNNYEYTTALFTLGSKCSVIILFNACVRYGFLLTIVYYLDAHV